MLEQTVSTEAFWHWQPLPSSRQFLAGSCLVLLGLPRRASYKPSFPQRPSAAICQEHWFHQVTASSTALRAARNKNQIQFVSAILTTTLFWKYFRSTHVLLFSQLVRNTFLVSKRIPHSFFGKLICIFYVLRLKMQQKILLGMWKTHTGTGMLRSPSRICVSGLKIILDHSKPQSSQFLSKFYQSRSFYINTFRKSGKKKRIIFQLGILQQFKPAVLLWKVLHLSFRYR